MPLKFSVRRYTFTFSGVLDVGPFPTRFALQAGRRSAAGDQETDRRFRGGTRPPDAARRHRIGQDVHHRERRRSRAAADARARAEQDARRAALRRVQGILPAQRGGIFRQLLRLLPARSVYTVERYLHRQGFRAQRTHRADASVGDEGADRAPRFADRGDGVGDLRSRRSGRISQDGAAHGARRSHRSARSAAPSHRIAIRPRRLRTQARQLSRARRSDRRVPGRKRNGSGAHRAVRRHRRKPFAVRSAHRRRHAPHSALHGLSRFALRDDAPHGARSGRNDQGRTEGTSRRTVQGEQARRSAAPAAAHAVRHRDDGRDRLLQRHRKLFAASDRTRARRAAAVSVRLSCRRMRCSSSTNRT